MAIDIPRDVAAVSLAVVGCARVLLRSDGRLHCVECDKAELADLAAARFGDLCQHIMDVAQKGVVRMATDEQGRRYPEFVWLRGGHKTLAHHPRKNDPDGAREVLMGVLNTIALQTRGTSDSFRASVADQILANLRAKGFIVVPEWAGTSRGPVLYDTGRTARALDLEE